MIHMFTRFEDGVFVRFSVITKNAIFSYIKGYRETTLRSPCDVIDDVITMRIVFLHNLGWSFHFCCQFEALCNILTFSIWPPFWPRDEIFTGSNTGIWIYQEDSHEHLWHFEYLIDALAQILTELLQFKVLTYFVIWWRYQWCNP